MKLLFLIGVVLVPAVQPFSNGQVERACNNMMPNHGVSVNQGPLPYAITVTNLGQGKLRVKIGGGPSFKGFFIKAETNDGQGKFIEIPRNAQYVQCSPRNSQEAVSHNDPEPKNSMELIYQHVNPSTPVTFRATVVQSYDTIWTNINKSYP